MRDLRVNAAGVELQVREYEREGEAIIFLHYGGGNLMMWAGVVPYFQDTYRLILVDLRGHGKSDKPPAGYHIDDKARDVVEVMEHLGLARAHVVGSSLGAEVGLSMAASYPTKVTSLVAEGALSSEYGPYGTWAGSEAEFKAYVAAELAKLRDQPAQVFASAEAFVAASRQSLEKQGLWNPLIAAVKEYDVVEIGVGKFTSSLPRWALLEYLEHYFEYRFEDYYRRVQCPVLMLPAEDDWQNDRTRSVIQRMAELVPGSKVVLVPGWAHASGWFLNPEGVSRVIGEFLAEVSRMR